MSKQATCEERIEDQLTGRLDDFRDFELLILSPSSDTSEDDLRAAAVRLGLEYLPDNTAETIAEDARECLYEYPLAVSKEEVWRIELSYGGPQDFFRVYYDRDDGTVTRITYHFLDWWDGAEKTLEGSDFEVAEMIARQITSDFYSES